ncbi:MAG: hypothetical protein M1609_08580, partial [Firmicutes bacterium]|nr:hypothetical protein [Bacillota bacterium]
MRKFGLILGLIFLSLVIVLSGCGTQTGNTQGDAQKAADTGKKVVKVGVSQFVAHPALDLDQKGFLDQMKELGFIQGQNVEFDIKNSQGDPN